MFQIYLKRAVSSHVRTDQSPLRWTLSTWPPDPGPRGTRMILKKHPSFPFVKGKIVKGTGTISTTFVRKRTCVCTGISVHALYFYFISQVTIPIQLVSILASSEVAQFSIAVCMILVHLIESWTDNRECAQWTADQLSVQSGLLSMDTKIEEFCLQAWFYLSTVPIKFTNSRWMKSKPWIGV